MSRVLALALLALAIAPAVAQADRAPTTAEAVAIAERWAAVVAPQHVNHCAGGRLRVEWAADLGRTAEGKIIRGETPGWMRRDGVDVWEPSRCIARLLIAGDAFEHCDDLVHEALHYVIGPEHVGPLAPGFPRHPPCIIDEPPRVDLFRAIVAELPRSRGPWRVGCTRDSRRMRCKASSSRARTRRFTAAVVGSRYTLSPAGEIT